MDTRVIPSCDVRGIPHTTRCDLFQELATDKTMRFVHHLTNSPAQMRTLITNTPKIHNIPRRIYLGGRAKSMLEAAGVSTEGMSV
jgi:hypothetical protein